MRGSRRSMASRCAVTTAWASSDPAPTSRTISSAVSHTFEASTMRAWAIVEDRWIEVCRRPDRGNLNFEKRGVAHSPEPVKTVVRHPGRRRLQPRGKTSTPLCSGGAAMNNVKTAFWMVLLTVLLVVVGRVVAGDVGMLVTFGLAIVLNGVAYWFSDRIALAMARAREVSQTEAPRLHAIADELALRSGVPKPRVYLSPDPTPNAFATGRNPNHAAIVVNQGLLELLNDREVAGVLAHELGHVHNQDILISSVVAVLAGAITMIANLAQWSLWFGGRDDRNSSPFGLIAVHLTALLAPLAATLVQLAVSRSREYEADATGARVSGDPQALASALCKLAQVNKRVSSPLAQPAFAHLYIVNPLSAGGVSSLFSTHPPVEERIRRLQAMALSGQVSA